LYFDKARLLARSFCNVNGFYALIRFYFRRCRTPYILEL